MLTISLKSVSLVFSGLPLLFFFFFFIFTFHSSCMLKCNYFCSSWCTIHQWLSHRFHFENFSRFLTVFVLLPFSCACLLCTCECECGSARQNYLLRSILSIHSLSFLSFCWHCFSTSFSSLRRVWVCVSFAFFFFVFLLFLFLFLFLLHKFQPTVEKVFGWLLIIE